MTKEEFRKEWIAALRSGKYEQGRTRLDYDGKYCCLGVACKLLADRGLLKRIDFTGSCGKTGCGYGNGVPMLGVMPEAAVELIGLVNRFGDSAKDNGRSLTSLNDTGTPFPEIADLLETGEYWDV